MIADLDANAAASVATDCRAVATNSKIRVEHVQIDITVEASVQQAVAHTSQAFGRIDYCVNSAGVCHEILKHHYWIADWSCSFR